jgi:ribosomal protein S18 acetylase RimI-like enzyme
MISIRPAVDTDLEVLYSFDLIAHRETKRREFIENSINSSSCYVAVFGDKVIGYAVLNYSFFGHGSIDMLYVDSNERRRGAGIALLQHLEQICQTPKLFTSTNLSNLPMQTLLNRLGYKLSGVIENLDEDDPEIVYFKRLR